MIGRPFRVLIIAGSDRRKYNCPGVDSKSRTLMHRMADGLPHHWEIDCEDLGTTAIVTRHWYGNAGMAASKFPIPCGITSNSARTNSENQAEDLSRHKEVYSELDAWTDRFTQFVEAKGKVQPNKYRAFGYKPPSHFLRDVSLAWRDIRMRFEIRVYSPHPRNSSGWG